MNNPQVFDLFDGKSEAVVGDQFSNSRKALMVHEREHLGLTGRLAVRLAEHFGVIAGVPDGNDEAGRQKFALLPPEQVVDRSICIAEMMVAGLRERGHIATLPSWREPEEQG